MKISAGRVDRCYTIVTDRAHHAWRFEPGRVRRRVPSTFGLDPVSPKSSAGNLIAMTSVIVAIGVLIPVTTLGQYLGVLATPAAVLVPAHADDARVHAAGAGGENVAHSARVDLTGRRSLRLKTSARIVCVVGGHDDDVIPHASRPIRRAWTARYFYSLTSSAKVTLT
jgi:hypothetical protein